MVATAELVSMFYGSLRTVGACLQVGETASWPMDLGAAEVFNHFPVNFLLRKIVKGISF